MRRLGILVRDHDVHHLEHGKESRKLPASLPIIEIFESIQGEGVRTGEPATFIRLAGCNLRCTWCDTTYSWSSEGIANAERMSPSDIAENIGTAAVVITGGEPLLHQKKLPALIGMIKDSERESTHVTVETNATICVDDDELIESVDLWSLSPKLPGSGEAPDSDALAWWLGATRPDRRQLKFVLADAEEDWQAMWALLEGQNGWDASPLVVQPNGMRDDYDQALRELVELVSKDRRSNFVRVLPQLHRVIWGNQARGV